MSRCPDCPDLPNGTRKRQICCKREGGQLKVGDVVPFVPAAPDIRPAFTGAGAPSFKPARKGAKGAGPMITNDEAKHVASELSPGQRVVIEKIGAAGPDGLSTFGWHVNWFTALFLSRKHPDLIVTGATDNRARLGAFGEEVLAAIRSDVAA